MINIISTAFVIYVKERCTSIFTFRFKMWTGIGRGNTTITPSEMEERNQRYRTLEGQIDYFPDQIDRYCLV